MNEEDLYRIPATILCQREGVASEWLKARNIGAGLMNRGNTCFINSVLQCLTHSAPLVNFFTLNDHSTTCYQKGLCMMCELQSHIKESFANSGSAIVPEAIIRKIKMIAGHMELGRQEDAHEFLIHVLDAMQRSCAHGINGLNQFNGKNTAVHQIFGGILRSQVQCMRCKATSDTDQPFIDISLEIKNVRTLEEAFWKYIRLESLGDDAYSCASCEQKVQANKGVTIKDAPKILTVSLQRFDYMLGKVCHRLQFPEMLDLWPYMCLTQGDTGSVIFELYAVVVHSGHSCNSGHYFSYVKSASGNWYIMNDSKVKPVPVSKVLSSQAYLLFYKKCGPSDTQNNAHVTNNMDSQEKANTDVGTLLSPASPKKCNVGTVDTIPDEQRTLLKTNNAASAKKRSWGNAFNEEMDPGKRNTSNTDDPMSACGNPTAPARKRLKPSRVKFVGRRISHEWVEDEASNTRNWYTGTVLRTVSGRDGYKSAVNDVLYDGEEKGYEIDHLLEDYASSSVKFIDN